MSSWTHRRGLFRGLITALFGCVAARAADSPPTPPRCRHYYDGVLWASGGAGKCGYYCRDTEGCPYCRPGADAGLPPLDPNGQGIGGTTHSYTWNGKQLSTIDPLGQVTTHVYDAAGRSLGERRDPPPTPA